VVARHFFV